MIKYKLYKMATKKIIETQNGISMDLSDMMKYIDLLKNSSRAWDEGGYATRTLMDYIEAFENIDSKPKKKRKPKPLTPEQIEAKRLKEVARKKEELKKKKRLAKEKKEKERLKAIKDAYEKLEKEVGKEVIIC